MPRTHATKAPETEQKQPEQEQPEQEQPEQEQPEQEQPEQEQPEQEARETTIPVVRKKTTAQYVVANSPIAPFGNGAAARAEHGDKARMYAVGDVVELTPTQARYYIDLRKLIPYVPAED